MPFVVFVKVELASDCVRRTDKFLIFDGVDIFTDINFEIFALQ